MSFADDIRKKHNDKPKLTPSPISENELAEKILEYYKEDLERNVKLHIVRKAYPPGGLILKKDCVETSIRIRIKPEIVQEEQGIGWFPYDDDPYNFNAPNSSKVWAHSKRDVKEFFNLLNEKCKKEGIELSLHGPCSKMKNEPWTYYDYIFRIFL